MYIARKDGEVNNESELRELYLTQVQCYAREAIDDLDMLQQVCRERTELLFIIISCAVA